MRHHHFCFAAAAALLCSCATTSVKQTSKAPGWQGPAGKIAVLTIEDRPMLRQGFENRLVAQLKKGGEAAYPTFDLRSLNEIKGDKRASAERLRSGGADSVLILRLVDVGSAYRETQPGGERYAGMVTGIETTGWYDYF